MRFHLSAEAWALIAENVEAAGGVPDSSFKLDVEQLLTRIVLHQKHDEALAASLKGIFDGADILVSALEKFRTLSLLEAEIVPQELRDDVIADDVELAQQSIEDALEIKKRASYHFLARHPTATGAKNRPGRPRGTTIYRLVKEIFEIVEANGWQTLEQRNNDVRTSSSFIDLVETILKAAENAGLRHGHDDIRRTIGEAVLRVRSS